MFFPTTPFAVMRPFFAALRRCLAGLGPSSPLSSSGWRGAVRRCGLWIPLAPADNGWRSQARQLGAPHVARRIRIRRCTRRVLDLRGLGEKWCHGSATWLHVVEALPGYRFPRRARHPRSDRSVGHAEPGSETGRGPTLQAPSTSTPLESNWRRRVAAWSRAALHFLDHS